MMFITGMMQMQKRLADIPGYTPSLEGVRPVQTSVTKSLIKGICWYFVLYLSLVWNASAKNVRAGATISYHLNRLCKRFVYEYGVNI